MSNLSQFIGGGVKSVQSGVFGAAGAATITAVVVAKSVIFSKSKGSAGTVAATGNIGLTPSSHNLGGKSGSSTGYTTTGDAPTYSGTLSGGTTDLTTKQYSVVLTNSTTVTADGPCEYQVVEYY